VNVKVFGSDSRGNGYLIQGIREDLLLEAGLHLTDLSEMMEYDFDRVAGCLVSHGHKDHSRCAKQLTGYGIGVYCKFDTLNSLKITGRNAIALQPFKVTKIGKEFEVIAFPVQHDVSSYGYIIRNKVTQQSILFATDTYYVDYTFDCIDMYLIEANYSLDIVYGRVERGEYNHEYSMRLRESHFEINNTIDFLKANDLSRTKKVVLIHLSRDNADPILFKQMVQDATGIETIIAEKGVEIAI
jgi:phosphoribosyl 1,2-cyclic phosphodiesterase